ncbi:uncharacterized protein [Procambarus clarkii]|uniref:uncharacterized protein n=1 Tax=Procambarus clarkii TaxID=6728 RepID=UPI0037421AA4
MELTPPRGVDDAAARGADAAAAAREGDDDAPPRDTLVQNLNKEITSRSSQVPVGWCRQSTAAAYPAEPTAAVNPAELTAAVNPAEPTAAVNPAEPTVATEATQKSTTCHPPLSAPAPPTVHASTEPSTPATRPAAVFQPSRAQPPRSTTSAFYSSDSSGEDVAVGTPSSPSRKCHYSPADFLHDTTQSTSNNSTTMSTRSQTDKHKKIKDQSLLKS